MKGLQSAEHQMLIIIHYITWAAHSRSKNLVVMWRLWFFLSIRLFIKKIDFDSIFSPQYLE